MHSLTLYFTKFSIKMQEFFQIFLFFYKDFFLVLPRLSFYLSKMSNFRCNIIKICTNHHKIKNSVDKEKKRGYNYCV